MEKERSVTLLGKTDDVVLEEGGGQGVLILRQPLLLEHEGSDGSN